VVREGIRAWRMGGVVSIVGVYGGMFDKFPMGVAMNKGLIMRMGQQHGQRYAPRLLGYVQQGQVDPSFVVTHKMSLDQAAEAFELMRLNKDDCLRVVFQ